MTRVDDLRSPPCKSCPCRGNCTCDRGDFAVTPPPEPGWYLCTEGGRGRPVEVIINNGSWSPEWVVDGTEAEWREWRAAHPTATLLLVDVPALIRKHYELEGS